LDSHIYGEPARDDSDEEEKENPELVGKTPNTRKRLIKEKATEEVEKLGPLATAFTLFKGIVCSGILYLPTSFVTGGWLFSGVALIFSLFLTLFCIKLLLEVRTKLGGGVSFPEIGFITYGKTGKILVDISLFSSQVGFTCAYIYFIASQVTSVLDSAFDINIPDAYKWVYAPICFAILFPMVMVRKIQTFSKFHLFGDIMIFLTVFTCMGYATASVVNNGWLDKDLPLFNSQLWPNSIGFAIYSFEGIGVILPIQDITADKENYFTIVCYTGVAITAVYMIFAEFCLFAWYNRFTDEHPLITDYLPSDSVYCWIVKLLFAFQLIISYTLVIYPANMIVESYLYREWPKSKKRQMCKNFTRALLIIFTIVAALVIYNKLESFLAIVGSLTCTPIAFILPAMFHYKACAETPKQKFVDGFIFFLSVFIMIFCTIYAVLAW